MGIINKTERKSSFFVWYSGIVVLNDDSILIVSNCGKVPINADNSKIYDCIHILEVKSWQGLL